MDGEDVGAFDEVVDGEGDVRCPGRRRACGVGIVQLTRRLESQVQESPAALAELPPGSDRAVEVGGEAVVVAGTEAEEATLERSVRQVLGGGDFEGNAHVATVAHEPHRVADIGANQALIVGRERTRLVANALLALNPVTVVEIEFVPGSADIRGRDQDRAA